MIEVKKLKKGDYIVYKEKPYRIKKIEQKVISRHSHTVTKIELEGILDKSREILTKGGHEKVEDVEIIRKLGQYISPMKENHVQIMSLDNYEVFEAEVLPEFMPKLTDGCNITFIEFKGRKMVIEVRK
jgi:translation elongation factor P/translation initiation factor 5A